MTIVPAGKDLESVMTDEQLEAVKHASEKLQAVMAELNSKVLVGQEPVVYTSMVTLTAGGNLNLVGKPGLGKSRLFENMAAAVNMDGQRIQCTADLMPSDITGYQVQDVNEDGKPILRFVEGPVFTQLCMLDEINRAAPRAQSGALQAMQDKKVTVDGVDMLLKKGFNVIATQNPVDQQGVYPLPEAQLDRFLMQIHIRNTTLENEKKFLDMVVSRSFGEYQKLVGQRVALMDAARKTTEEISDPDEKVRVMHDAVNQFLEREQGDNAVTVDTILGPTEMVEFQVLASTLPIGEEFYDTLCRLVRATRTESDYYEDDPDIANINTQIAENVEWGAGPRAQLAFLQATRARALIDGRPHPDLSDLKALAKPILRHRMRLNARAESGPSSANKIKLDKMIDQTVNEVLKL